MVEKTFFFSDRNPCQIWTDIRRKQLLCFVYRLNLAGEYCRSNFDITLYHSIYTYIFQSITQSITHLEIITPLVSSTFFSSPNIWRSRNMSSLPFCSIQWSSYVFLGWSMAACHWKIDTTTRRQVVSSRWMAVVLWLYYPMRMKFWKPLQLGFPQLFVAKWVPGIGWKELHCLGGWNYLKIVYKAWKGWKNSIRF